MRKLEVISSWVHLVAELKSLDASLHQYDEPKKAGSKEKMKNNNSRCINRNTAPLADSLRAGPLPPVFFLTAMSYWPLKFVAHKSKISLRMILAFHQSTRTKAWEVSWFYHPTAQLPVSCQIPNVVYMKCFSCRSLYKNVSNQEPWDRPNLKNKK